MALTPRTRRRLVVGGVVASLAALAVDTAAPAVTDPVRSAVARAVTPVQERLTLPADNEADRLRRQRDEARRALARRGDDEQLRRGLGDLLGSSAAADRRVVPARVVGFTPATAAGERQLVTIDAGSRDGIRAHQTVIATQGLVGRTVTVRPTSADVELVTSPGAVVGARVTRSRAIGSVAATPGPAVPARRPGEVTLTLVELGDVRTGDQVRTLGSVDDRPYVRDVVIGRVVGVDPDRGQLGRTARVEPAVDVGSLDVVGVVQPAPADGPRPAATGTGSS